MAYQTVSNSNAFVMGSCKIHISASTEKSTTTGSFMNLGSARGVKITESWDSLEIETDNTPKIIIGAKNQQITIEGSLLELNFQKLQLLRGGVDSFSTTTFIFNSGGNTTITPQAIYLTHTGASSSQTVQATIYYASVTEGMQLAFPADDKTEVMEIPFKIKGVCQSTRTAGNQLYSIVDTRTSVYAVDYSATTP
jgi:hypothetical protein